MHLISKFKKIQINLFNLKVKVNLNLKVNFSIIRKNSLQCSGKRWIKEN